MLTDAAKKIQDGHAALFLFCHQDDEFAVYHQILLERSRRRRVICFYLTSGVPYGGNPDRRNAESLAVLQELGVMREDIHFVGQQLGISDGHLLDHLPTALSWLRTVFVEHNDTANLYIPAWEGGHPDHDALHFLSVKICSDLGILNVVRQFSLYNAANCVWKFFRVLSPLTENGSVLTGSISWSNRIRFARHSLRYPSQWRSWLGLFPFYLFHLMVNGKQYLQGVSPERIFQRPHAGKLYYERRNFATWHHMQACTNNLDFHL